MITKMKKINSFTIVFLTILFYCCQGSSKDTRNTSDQEGVEIIQDNTFEKGFSLTPLDPKIVEQGGGLEKTYLDTLDFNKDGSHPIWHIAQWYSKYNLAQATPVRDREGAIWYANEGNSKKIALYPDNSLLLEVNASLEYDSPRVSGQNWPHLLIAQNFNKNSPNVGEARQLLFSMELKLEKEENKMIEGDFNASLHTAQSPFYFILRNDNENSPDFKQQIWFGIPSYDYRFTEMNDQETVSWDIGTNTFIYNVPQQLLWGDISFQDKKWHKSEADLKPLILRALEAMKGKGVFKNTSLDDMYITYMNFGWEVPGTFDVAIRVKNISLTVIK